MKISIHFVFKLSAALILLLQGCSLLEIKETMPACKIGVMLPYSGEYASEWDTTLEWAVENINMAGGVAGRKIELVKKDIAVNNPLAVAKEFIADDEIKAVIGPFTSSEVFAVAPEFIVAKKVLIAPVASAASISRAFAGYDYIWRLTEPDISQVKTLLLIAQKKGARSVALITEESEYGASFEDWFGYFATELGLNVSLVTVINPGDMKSTVTAWNDMVKTHPDAVIAALNLPAQNIELVKAYRSNSQQIELLFSDVFCLPALPAALGSLAENLEGTTISSDPSSGFDVSYHAKYGKYPGAYLGSMYDAVMLLALALQASNGEGSQALAEALKKVVSGRSGKGSWQRDALAGCLQSVRAGIFPDIVGASGALDFDDLYFTDVSSTTYGHWRIDNGQFVITDFYTSDGTGRISSTSAAYRVIAEKKQYFSTTGTWPSLQPRKGLYAVLMATSQGWSNYRHQADILQTYQTLKSRGVDDDHILLIMADDLANSPSSKQPGKVINEPGGNNLYYNVKIDYNLKGMTGAKLSNILTGIRSAETPVVLPSTSTDNILIFTSGHGTPSGMSLEGSLSEVLSPGYWKTLFSRMAQNQNFRQIFWAMESCYSGKIGEAVATPGVMIMTGANPYETSKAIFYDATAGAWLADKFAYSVNNAIATSSNLLFSDLYERCFKYVNGSHVSFYNYQNFGNIYQIDLRNFVTP